MRRKNAIKWAMLPIAATLIMALTGCTPEQASRGLLPGSAGVTDRSDIIADFWVGSWMILWGVGIIAWGLMFYAIIVYRRRRGETGTPPQLRYNNPIETLFTVVPLILVVGFFAFTAKTMAQVEQPFANPDVKIQVVGKQWAWDFNYVKENTFDAGVQLTGVDQAGTANTPTLWLPVNKKVEIALTSRDVVHSFWVIDFLYKKDVFPGKTNYMYIEPKKTGLYMGKCAELCGEYHSMMLFNVNVVSQAEYDAHIAQLAAAGNVGQLDDSYNREQNKPGDDPAIRG